MKLRTQTSLATSIKALMNSKKNSRELVEMPMRTSQPVKTSLESSKKVAHNFKQGGNTINKTSKIPLMVLDKDSLVQPVT